MSAGRSLKVRKPSPKDVPRSATSEAALQLGVSVLGQLRSAANVERGEGGGIAGGEGFPRRFFDFVDLAGSLP